MVTGIAAGIAATSIKHRKVRVVCTVMLLRASTIGTTTMGKRSREHASAQGFMQVAKCHDPQLVTHRVYILLPFPSRLVPNSVCAPTVCHCQRQKGHRSKRIVQRRALCVRRGRKPHVRLRPSHHPRPLPEQRRRRQPYAAGRTGSCVNLDCLGSRCTVFLRNLDQRQDTPAVEGATTVQSDTQQAAVMQPVYAKCQPHCLRNTIVCIT
jgi:hypothetical protein